jgi:CRP/FNR family transcriptional regulator, cyclic AMP receptor protein
VSTAIAVQPPQDQREGTLSWFPPAHEAPGSGVRVLEVDHGLAGRLSPRERERLTPLLRVPVEFLEAGSWRPGDRHCNPATFGLLVIDGMILRDVVVGGRRCAELLGPGNLLRPGFEPDDVDASVPATPEWCVLDGHTRVAILDERASRLIGRFPGLVAELLDRSLIRARSLQFQLALTQVQGVDTRLELLFWHLADRWGRVTPAGVVVPMPLTHEMLGRLLGARRPSVSSALSAMTAEGRIDRCDEGWILHGEQPGDDRSLSPVL